MFVVRPVRTSDIDALKECAEKVGMGMTHLPDQKDILSKKIDNSIKSFAHKGPTTGKEEYIFVLEDLASTRVCGTCAVYASTGSNDPFYFFSIIEMDPLPSPMQRPTEKRLLKLESYQGGPSEIGALFVLPEFRKGGVGKLLSYSRFLFIAAFPTHFQKQVLANLRGRFNGDGAVFWNGVGRHFVDYDFVTASTMQTRLPGVAQTIFPSYPIPISFLLPEVQQVIGKVCPESEPAFVLLLKQGFHYINQIDPFDGGPLVQSDVDKIPIIAQCQERVIREIMPSSEVGNFVDLKIICNKKLDFRVCYGQIKELDSKYVAITETTATALDVGVADIVKYVGSS